MFFFPMLWINRRQAKRQMPDVDPVENKIIKETMCSQGSNTIDSSCVDFTKNPH